MSVISMGHTYLESHGVLLHVEVQDDGLADQVGRILPPGWREVNEFPEDGHFALVKSGSHLYDVLVEGFPAATGVTAEVALHVLDAQLRTRIAARAKERIFVHAGVVSVENRALLIPGPSFSGKSALVAALVSAGASYFSDEFAVLDSEGNVHPYAKMLSLRPKGARYGERVTAEALGGSTGTQPARASLVVITRFVPREFFAPQERSSGVGALALLSNAVAARARTEEAIRATSRATEGARVLEGTRGEAEEAAALLLEQLGHLDPA